MRTSALHGTTRSHARPPQQTLHDNPLTTAALTCIQRGIHCSKLACEVPRDNYRVHHCESAILGLTAPVAISWLVWLVHHCHCESSNLFRTCYVTRSVPEHPWHRHCVTLPQYKPRSRRSITSTKHTAPWTSRHNVSNSGLESDHETADPNTAANYILSENKLV